MKQREKWARAQVLADRSVQMGDVPLGHLLQAKIGLWRKFDHDRAVTEARRAVALDPNFAEGHAMLGEVLLYNGQPDGALKSLNQATRLNPSFPDRYGFLMGQAKFHQGNYQAALEDMANYCKIVTSNIYARSCVYYQASAHAHAGDIAKAKFAFRKYAVLYSIASVSSIIAVNFPFKHRGVQEKLIEGIAKAYPD